MGCCAPNAVGAGPEAADPCKRVNYTLGMLLGVDDFVQESAYHGARRRELARELLGYGTVHGLQVVVEEGGGGPRVRVTPGMAWLPSGTPVCVASAQCANLNDWLAAHAADLPLGSPGLRLPLYLVLSHAQCLTDNVPIPGEPCRDDSELMQPSRVADGFRLELRLAPPPQLEEDAVRDFVAWLVDLPLAPSSPPLDEAAFIEQLRQAARAWLAPSSPPVSPPDFMLGAAPAGTSESIFSTALRLWTTELRPLWMARANCGCDAAPIAAKDDAVLLAELWVEVVASGDHWVVSHAEDAVTSDESRRPFVLSLRMVQELVTRHPVPDPGDSVVAETAFGQARDAGISLHFARADHTHGTPALPGLGGDLSGTLPNARVEKLQGVTLVTPTTLVNGQVMTVQGGQWRPQPLPPPPPLPSLGGDLSGAIGNARVEKLQGIKLVTPTTLVNGHVLTVQGGEWKPQALPPPPPAPTPAPIPPLAGDVTGAIGANQVAKLQGKTLNAPNPLANQILRFIGNAWTAVDLPAAPAPAPTQFVARGTELPFEIVAAADVALLLRLPGGPAPEVPVVLHRYGEIEVPKVTMPDKNRALVDVVVKLADAQKFTGHIVKLTPVWDSKTPFGFRVYLFGKVGTEGADTVFFRVLVLADQSFNDAVDPFGFQVELSRFGEKP